MGDDASRWSPDGYIEFAREEIPAYDDLQQHLVDASRRVHAHRILDLGSGTGETARRLLDAHPHAELHGIDASEQMLAAARESLAGRPAHFRTGQLEHPLPSGEYDLVASALAVHHLTPAEKRQLFERVAAILPPGGRFVLADVVIPDDPEDTVTILSDYDRPSSIPDHLDWLQAIGLEPHLCWTQADLAVIAADRPA